MKIKSILGAVIIIILIIVIGFFLVGTFSTQNKVKYGDANFLLPEGYKEEGLNKYRALTITNGTNDIFIFEHNSDNVNKYVSDYKQVVKNKNETMTIENMTINNTVFYKTNNVNNPDVTHYWFVKNGHTYEIYKYDKNSKFESSVIYLQNHMT